MKISLLLMLYISLGLTVFLIDVVRVTGNSMTPTLQAGKFLLINKAANYDHNDLIVFRPAENLKARPPRFIKRMIALPNDSISVQKGQVYLNSMQLEESYTFGKSNDSFPELLIAKGEVIAFEGFTLSELPDYLQDTFEMLEPLPQNILEQSQQETISFVGTIKLKEGFYFVLGDNRSYGVSEDSRVFGAISKDSLLGKVLY